MSERTSPSTSESREALRTWAAMARAEARALRAKSQALRERSFDLLADALERGGRDESDEPGRALRSSSRDSTIPAIFAMANLTVEEIWIEYAGLGGDRTPDQVTAYLRGDVDWPALERQILAHVLNEHLTGSGTDSLAGYAY